MEAGLFALIVAVAVAAFLIDRHLKAERRRRWLAMADALGLVYSPTDDAIASVPMNLLRSGDTRSVDNVLTGEMDGARVALFEFTYVERGHGQDSSDTVYTFTCAMTSLALRAPHTVIKREGFFTRFADAVGFRDFEFESEEFNRAWEVHGGDKRFASYLIDARMMEHLLATGGHSFEVLDDTLLAYRKRCDVSEAPETLRAALRFREHVPRAALDTYGG